MTDRDDLRNLSTGYAAAVDALDGDAFAALFTPDGELWVPDVSQGSTAPTIRRAGPEELRRIPGGLARYRATSHLVGATSYEIDTGSATGTVIGVAHHLSASDADAAVGQDAGPGVDTIWYLRYEDRYRREPDGWRIAKRELHLRWIEQRPVGHVGPGRDRR